MSRQAPDAVALVLDDNSYTYGQLVTEAMDVSRGLVAAGIRRGDNVGLLMPTSREFVISWLGTALAGARVVPINTRFRRRELSFVIAKAELKGLLTTDLGDAGLDLLSLVRDALPALEHQEAGALHLADAPQLRFVVALGAKQWGGFTTEAQFLERGRSIPDEAIADSFAGVARDDVALVSFTSGTTSNPKGCLLTHGSLMSMWDATAERLKLRQGDVCWVPAPMFHAVGYGGLGIAAGIGGTVISQGHFRPEDAARLMPRHRPRFWYSPFPPVTDAVIEAAQRRGDDLSSVEVAVYVAPSPVHFDRLSAALPSASVVQPFGQTESTLFVTLGSPNEPYDMRRTGSGTLFEGVEMRLVEPVTGDAVKPGEPGEIQYRGFNAFQGYLMEPELTRQTILDGGWVRSGDIGRLDEFGQLQCIGRLKDMLKVGGENVSALEVESHLQTHPAIRMVQVVAAPDDRLQEVPCAYIELEPGQELDEQAVIDYCRGEIARYKVPRYVRFVDSWPMSTTKIRKADLRQMIAEELRQPQRLSGVPAS
jgi:acyl-CoA synthetase (AMP-forming)/AMP-acid ligase II